MSMSSTISESEIRCQSQQHPDFGLGDMLDAVIAHFPEWDPSEEDDDRPRIAIVGKPNVGKSSIVKPSAW